MSILTSFLDCLYCLTISRISPGDTPLPFAIRSTREPSIISGSSSSFLVIEFIACFHFLSLPSWTLSASFGSDIEPSPGIISITFPSGPILLMASICWYKSSMLNSPERSFFSMSFASSSVIASFAFSRSASRSPIPRSRPKNPFGLNCSMSSTFSPTPMNLMGAPVIAQALNAPPPFAVPSILVMMTPLIAPAL